jgi:hypothetical protein
VQESKKAETYESLLAKLKAKKTEIESLESQWLNAPDDKKQQPPKSIGPTSTDDDELDKFMTNLRDASSSTSKDSIRRKIGQLQQVFSFMRPLLSLHAELHFVSNVHVANVDMFFLSFVGGGKIRKAS